MKLLMNYLISVKSFGLIAVLATSCSSLPKPDVKACFNLMVGGYGGCSTSQTKKRTILSPSDWATMKAGPGFWLTPEEVAKQKKFALSLCEKSKMCSKDLRVEINKQFDIFEPQPVILDTEGGQDEQKRSLIFRKMGHNKSNK